MAMDQEELLASYEAAARITGEMLAAARASEWERFSALETACANEIQRMKFGDSPKPLSALQRTRKIEVITRILANDREIRLVTEPWMSRLSSLLGGTTAVPKLARAHDEAETGYVE
jgi:flagellar protein FliT